MKTKFLLGAALGLKPLDRLQVNSKRHVTEARHDARARGAKDLQDELPWWYFQRVLPDGRLEVRSPGGYVDAIAPEDCCDVIPCREPVHVRALPKARFLDTLKGPAGQGRALADEDYAMASVLYVTRDRWGRVDRVAVWFDDCAHNADCMTFAPVHPQDHAGLEALAVRTRMPVISVRRGAPASADYGVQARRTAAGHAVRTFFRVARSGAAQHIADAIREAGARLEPLTTAQINRMGATQAPAKQPATT